MRRPIQVWLSQVSENLAFSDVKRDSERAFKERGDASTIWLMPGLDKEVRWAEDPFDRLLAIRSHHMDRIDVYHIGENGRAFGLGAGSRFPNGSIHRLLDIWLSMPKEAQRFGLLPEKDSIHAPMLKDGKHLGYEDVTINLQSRTAFPKRIIDEEKRIVGISWPPAGQPAPISPDAESSDIYGNLTRTIIDGVPMVTSAKHPELRSLPLWVDWPPPIKDLMPRGSGLDELLAWRSMVAIAEKGRSDQPGSVREAWDQARDYVSESTATRESTWLWPTVIADGEESVLFDLERDLGLTAKSLDQVVRMPKARRFLDEEVPVRRAWGARGLFWALLLERLESEGQFARCELCNRLNPAGRRGKRFCGRSDDKACFLRRIAGYKRHARGKR